MLTLYLLRHAKSSWDQPGISDFDRPLAPRGREAAPRMGRYMKDAGYAPELILCSRAVRARETMDLVLDALGSDPETRFVDGLYNFGSGQELLHILQQLRGDIGQLMVIGHNPSMENLARSLTGAGDDAALADLTNKYPTAALAVMEFDADAWSDLLPDTGRLVQFTKPRSLDAPL